MKKVLGLLFVATMVSMTACSKAEEATEETAVVEETIETAIDTTASADSVTADTTVAAQ